MPKHKREEICLFCSEEASVRLLRSEKKAFNELNPERDPNSKRPLNDAQETYIRVHFCGHDGHLDRICYEHLKELASIGRGKIACLVKVFSNSQFGQLYDLESAPSPRKKHRPHNKTDDEIVDDVILFCVDNSEFVPNEVNIRRLSSNVRSKRRAHLLWNFGNPTKKLPWTTFFRVLRNYCPNIKVI
jgi:hypothetical protein